jgi:DnaK suppressor protein
VSAPGADPDDPVASELAAAADAGRRAARRRVEDLARELAEIATAAAGSNADDEHDPEGSTLGYEGARVRALLARAATDLAELDEAAARLAAGAPLLCSGCGEPIPLERLLARPAARSCVRCAAAPPSFGGRRAG